MSEPSDFPLAVYRDGHDFDWDGRSVAHRHVTDEDALTEARADGWLPAAEFLASGKGDLNPLAVLDQNAPEIIAALDGQSGEQLLALYDAEKVGKGRKGVIAAIEEAIAKVSE